MTVRELMRKLEFAPKDMEIATIITGHVAPVNRITFANTEQKGHKQSQVILEWRAE